MEHKVCLVTGATSGIGYEIAAGLLRLGATVVVTARDETRGQAALAALKNYGGTAELLLLDLSSLASVRRAAAEFLQRFNRLDVLVNNAGTSLFSRQLTVDGYETNFATNHLGPFLFTQLLVDILKKSAPSRVLNVTSSALARPDLDDLMSEKSFVPLDVYAKTKAANILFTAELADRLAGTGVTVNCVHPGVVKTGLVRDARGFMKVLFAIFRLFFITPAQGAQNSIYATSSPEVEGLTGKYFVGKSPSPCAYLDDLALRRGLWAASEQLVK